MTITTETEIDIQLVEQTRENEISPDNQSVDDKVAVDGRSTEHIQSGITEKKLL